MREESPSDLRETPDISDDILRSDHEAVDDTDKEDLTRGLH